MNITILGAGLTGMITAVKLKEKGHNVSIIEKTDRLGGSMSLIVKGNTELNFLPCYVEKEKKNDLNFKIRIGKKFIECPLDEKLMYSKWERLKKKLKKKNEELNFELNDSLYEFLTNNYGGKGYSILFNNLTRKMWAEPEKLDVDLAFSETLNLIINKKNLAPYNVKELIDNLTKKINKMGINVYKNTEPVRVNIKRSKIDEIVCKHKLNEFAIKTDYLISTIHMNNLLDIMPEKTGSVVRAVNKLKFKQKIMVYFKMRLDNDFDWSMVYFPEKDYMFYRTINMNKFTKNKNAVIAAEIVCEDNKLSKMDSDELKATIAKQLKNCGLINPSQVMGCHIIKFKYGMPIYQIGYQDYVETFHNYLDNYENIISIGRMGGFCSLNVDNTFKISEKITEHVDSNKGKEEWKELRFEFYEYPLYI